jgi:aspartyl-tRNA(Asn)/glutamyl-tRNA(Gln) amidotransferase subunit B
VVAVTNDPKKSCSYVTTVVLALMKQENIEDIHSLKLTSKKLAEIINLVNKDELSSTNAKVVIEEIFANGGEVDAIVDSKNLRQKNDLGALEAIVDEVLGNSAKQIEDYKS